MSEFAFRRAHANLAAPEYKKLPESIKALVRRVHHHAANLQQGRDLDMPWTPGLRKAFEAVPTRELARAAQVVYFYGHWGSRDCYQDRGTYWKFANYCDQILSARLGLVRDRGGRSPCGISYEVHEGQLRACWLSRQSWLWDNIGPATKRTLRQIRTRKYLSGNIEGYPGDTWFKGTCEAFLKDNPPPRYVRGFYNLEEYHS
jgi:hypothetical protein